MPTKPEEVLAIAGGRPVRTAPMPGENGRLMGTAEIEAVTAVIRSGELGRHRGSTVKALERSFAELYGMKHAVAVSSGSSPSVV